METQGILNTVARDLPTGKYIISFKIDRLPSDLEALSGCDALDITAVRHRNHRSKNANALLWECLGRIASTLRMDKWSVYLQILKRYGEYTYVCVKPRAVEMLKRQWRECEEIGNININGQEAVQMLCYYGSSTYDTKQFSVLLDGVISEMKEMGLDTPTSDQMRQALEAWEKAHEQKE